MSVKKYYFFKNTYVLIGGFKTSNYSVQKNDIIYICIDEDIHYDIFIHDIQYYKNNIYCLCIIDLILEKKYCIIMLNNIMDYFDVSYIDYRNPGQFDWMNKIYFFEKDLLIDNKLFIYVDNIKLCFNLDTFSFYGNMWNILIRDIRYAIGL